MSRVLWFAADAAIFLALLILALWAFDKPAHGQTLEDLRNAPQYTWTVGPAEGPVVGYIWAVADWPCTNWQLYAATTEREVVLPFGAEKCVRVRARKDWNPENFGPWSRVSAEPGCPCVCE